MSRITIYQDARLTVIGGKDHMLGEFLQVFDKQLEAETPEGEGLVYDWSQKMGIETDLTGLPKNLLPMQVALQYIKECTC